MSGYELRSIGRQEQDAGPKERSGAREKLPEVVLVTPTSDRLKTDANGQPVDRCKIVFIILLIHGIGTLMPWNMFINAEEYFRKYKLMPALNGANTTDAFDRDIGEIELNSLRKNFLSYLGSASQLPNALFSGLNLVVNLGSGNLRLRVNLSLATEAAIFTLTTILAVVDSYRWPGAFFYITMISVVLLNMAGGVYQNCVFGTAAKFPSAYTNAILIGSNLSGTFTSVVNLLSIWLAPEPQIAAMYYFLTALFILVICLISYNVLHLNAFFRHYDDGKSSAMVKTNQLEIGANGGPLKTITEDVDSDVPETLRKTVDAMVPKPRSNALRKEDDSFIGELKRKWLVFKKCWPQCLNVFLTFYITLTLFPTVLADIKQLQDRYSDRYFSGFACFLVFNLFAMAGNLVSGWTTWPGKDHVWMIVVARVLFLPFFLFCNFHPASRRWPVLIRSDSVYILGNVLMALSSGYLSSLCMMFASSGLEPDEASKAGMLAAFFLVFGIVTGINSSFICTWIVELG